MKPWLVTIIGFALGIGVGLSIAYLGPVGSERDRADALQTKNTELQSENEELHGTLDSLETIGDAFDGPEDEPTEQEERQESDTIPGDGVFEVGHDVKPGLYTNSGGRMEGAPCVGVASRNGDTVNGFIRASNSEGPGRIRLKKGEIFTTNYCNDWERQ